MLEINLHPEPNWHLLLTLNKQSLPIVFCYSAKEDNKIIKNETEIADRSNNFFQNNSDYQRGN